MPGVWDDPMTTAETAEYMRVSKSKLATWRKLGGGPVFVKLERAVLYLKPDVDRWLEQHRLGRGPEGGVDD